jgi:hypothetical protein
MYVLLSDILNHRGWCCFLTWPVLEGVLCRPMTFCVSNRREVDNVEPGQQSTSIDEDGHQVGCRDDSRVRRDFHDAARILSAIDLGRSLSDL